MYVPAFIEYTMSRLRRLERSQELVRVRSIELVFALELHHVSRCRGISFEPVDTHCEVPHSPNGHVWCICGHLVCSDLILLITQGSYSKHILQFATALSTVLVMHDKRITSSLNAVDEHANVISS